MASDNFYVYYRITAAHEAAAQQAVDALFTHIRRSGLCAAPRLLFREQADTGEQTWMEVYEKILDSDALLHRIEAALAPSGFAALQPPVQRKLEIFRPR